MNPPSEPAKAGRDSLRRKTGTRAAGLVRAKREARRERIARKLRNFTPSITLAQKEIVSRRRAKGLPVFDFGLGATKGALLPELKAGGVAAFQNEHTSYIDPAGLPELRDQIINWLDYQGIYGRDNVVVTAGAKQALFNAIMTVCNPGDVVLTDSAPWVSYVPLIHCASAKPAAIEPADPSNGLKISSLDLRNALSFYPKVKIFLLNSPCNPTGQVYSREELAGLLDVCLEKKVYFMLDRLYWKIIFDGRDFPEPEITEPGRRWIIQIDGLSKAFRSAGGLRIGWSVAPEDLTQAMINLQSHTSSGASVPAQEAALAAISRPYDREMTEALQRKRGIIYTGLREVPYLKFFPTEGAYYSFWDIRETFKKRTPDGRVLLNSSDTAAYLADSAGVVAVPGSAFLQDNYLRASFHIPDGEIKEGLAALKKAFEELR